MGHPLNEHKQVQANLGYCYLSILGNGVRGARLLIPTTFLSDTKTFKKISKSPSPETNSENLVWSFTYFLLLDRALIYDQIQLQVPTEDSVSPK